MDKFIKYIMKILIYEHISHVHKKLLYTKTQYKLQKNSVNIQFI